MDKQILRERKNQYLIYLVVLIVSILVFLFCVAIYNSAYWKPITNQDLEFEYTIEDPYITMNVKTRSTIEDLELEIIYKGENERITSEKITDDRIFENRNIPVKAKTEKIKEELNTEKIKVIYLKITEGYKQNDSLPVGWIILVITGLILVFLLIVYLDLKKETKKKIIREFDQFELIQEDPSLLQQHKEQLLEEPPAPMKETPEDPNKIPHASDEELKEQEINCYKQIALEKQQQLLKEKEERQTRYKWENYQNKYGPGTYRCRDNDMVRSKGERDIDDFFFDNHIEHEYENWYCHPENGIIKSVDFYLPQYDLWIEYFGKNEKKYKRDAREKIKLYRSDPNMKFEYITYNDDKEIYEKLKSICKKYNIPYK